jgi:hypothetical protein
MPTAALALAPAPAFVTPIWPNRTARAVPARFEWHRGETLAIADHHCAFCHGLGLCGGRLDATQPCNCVLRAIFRAVMQHYHLKRERSDCQFSRCTLANFGAGNTGRRKWAWGHPDHEFMVDAEMLAKRILEPEEHRIFKLHELSGLDWRDCCRILRTEKGKFFHAVYRMEQKYGRAAREMQPYPLYPIGVYYGYQTGANSIQWPTAAASTIAGGKSRPAFIFGKAA